MVIRVIGSPALVASITMRESTAALAKSEKEKVQLSHDATVIDQAIKTATENAHDKILWEVEIATAPNRIMEVHIDSQSGK
jgi:hypothetical protein